MYGLNTITLKKLTLQLIYTIQRKYIKRVINQALQSTQTHILQI
jgi:hypothetical protein